MRLSQKFGRQKDKFCHFYQNACQAKMHENSFTLKQGCGAGSALFRRSSRPDPEVKVGDVLGKMSHPDSEPYLKNKVGSRSDMI